MSIATINPATGETIKTFTPATDDEIEAAIAHAHERFLDYRHSTSFAQRAEWANATADLLEKEADEVGAMMTLEMGKTLKSAKARQSSAPRVFATTLRTPRSCWPTSPPRLPRSARSGPTSGTNRSVWSWP